MKNIKWLQLIASIAVCQLAGIIGSIFTVESVTEWYPGLSKPGLTPPGWVFGPVWITLFLLMGIALYLVWQKRKTDSLARAASDLFVVHLVFNTMWSVIFFGLRFPGAAFAEIVILWLLIAVLVVMFWRVDRRAGLLLLPYFAWVSFAAWLNFMIWHLN